MDRNWILEQLLNALKISSDHEARIKSLEHDREHRSRFFNSGAPQWLAFIVALAALVLSLFK